MKASRIIIILLFILACYAIGKPGSMVSEADLSHLMIAEDDLPWEAILYDLKVGTQVQKMGMLEFAQNLPMFRLSWSGPPTAQPETLMTRHYGADIELAVAHSPEGATSIAVRAVHSGSVVIPEVTGNNRIASFADRAWFGNNAHGGTMATGAGLVFIRRNVVASVHVSHKDGADADTLFALAARLGERIDAALSGKPEPAPILPPSLLDMKIDLQQAWDMKGMTRLPGAGTGAGIALQKGANMPRALAVLHPGKGSYMISLSCFAGIIGTKAAPRVTGTHASVVLEGRNLVFTQDKAQATVGGRTIDLGVPVRFKGKQVFVPFSVMNKALGYRVTWREQGKVRVAVIGSRRQGEKAIGR